MPIADPLHDTHGSTEAVLSFLQHLLGATDEPLANILEGLAESFSADGGGLAILSSDPEPNTRTLLSEASWLVSSASDFPWEHNADFLKQLKAGHGSLTLTDGDDNSWLVTTVLHANHPWLLWLACRWPRVWTQTELTALELAAKFVLKASLSFRESQKNSIPSRPQVQEKLDTAVAVTRRLTHDFCNVLTSIQGFAELSLMNLKPDAPAHRWAKEVVESSRQGATWAHKMQMFSQSTRQRFMPASLVPILTAEALQPHWKESVTLKLDIEPKLPPIAIEGDALFKVLTALLDNAREAITGPGVVTLSAQSISLQPEACLELLGNVCPGPHVEITIADTGTGLSADAEARLFRDMFFTTKGRRRGLGLPLVYGTLQSFRAGFRIGNGTSQGAVVRVYIPVAKPVK